LQAIAALDLGFVSPFWSSSLVGVNKPRESTVRDMNSGADFDPFYLVGCNKVTDPSFGQSNALGQLLGSLEANFFHF